MKIIKRVLSIEFLVELILSIFVVINFSTISEYFLSSGFNPATSYGAGAVMGALLMGFALMLSRIEKGDDTFNIILVGTIVAAIVASILQTQAYHHITSDWMTSIIKGTGFPILEVSLAYCTSLYSTYMKSREELIIQEMMHRKRLEEDAELEGIKRKMTNDAKIKIYRAVAESFDGLQIESIKAEVVPFVNEFAARQGRYIISEMDPTTTQHVDTIGNDVATLAETLIQKVVTIQEAATEQQQLDETDTVADARQRNASTLEMLQQHLADNYDGVATTDLSATTIGNALGINKSTVSRNIKKLQEQQLLNGHVVATLLR